MLRLKCCVQNYAWGKIGESSTVAQIVHASTGVAIDKDKPYAEYWVGTHVNGPSTVVQHCGSERPLKKFLIDHPECLSTK